MNGYADPELLIGKWLQGALGEVKVWLDPNLPGNWRYTAPLVHVQRGRSLDVLAVTLDDVTLDVDVYAANADHARQVASDVCSAVEFGLRGHTFDNGVTVAFAKAITRPIWAPDPGVCRRTAAYEVVLHGLA